MPMFWEVWKFSCGCAVLAVILFGICWAVATLIEAARERREDRRMAPLVAGSEQMVRVLEYLDRTYGYKPSDAHAVCLGAWRRIIDEMSQA